MKKLQKEFNDFLERIKPSGTHELREKRDKLTDDIKKDFPDLCSAYGIEVNKSDLRFINQGSYIIGTAIYGKNIDIDYAMIMPLDIEEHRDPRPIKKAVYDCLYIENKRIPAIKEPCVTVAYHCDDEEYMHIDFPIYAEHDGSLYLGRGKKSSESFEWEKADPEGLKEHFLSAFKDKEQLKRIVMYIKKWKQLQYATPSSSNEVPPSVALTLLACEHFSEHTTGGDDDLSALYYTMKNIKDAFEVTYNLDNEIISVDIKCDLPVEPYTDVLYKMRKSAAHLVKFYKKLCRAVDCLREAVNLSEEHEAAKYAVMVLGDEFTVPEKKAKYSSTHNKAEYNYG